MTRVVEQGDCFTVRLYFSAGATDPQIQAVLDLLAEREALLEKGSRLLWAVGLRTRKDYDWIGSVLQPFVADGIATFESSFQPDEPQVGETA